MHYNRHFGMNSDVTNSHEQRHHFALGHVETLDRFMQGMLGYFRVVKVSSSCVIRVVKVSIVTGTPGVTAVHLAVAKRVSTQHD
jgi:hypothetical protein